MWQGGGCGWVQRQSGNRLRETWSAPTHNVPGVRVVQDWELAADAEAKRAVSSDHQRTGICGMVVVAIVRPFTEQRTANGVTDHERVANRPDGAVRVGGDELGDNLAVR